MAVVETHEPLPRFAHRAAAVGGKAYVWGGRAKDFHDAETRAKLSLLESFDPLTELWLTPARGTTGDHPPGLYDGAIAVAGGSLYHYGGYDGASFFNALSKSDISEFPKPNSNWSLLSSVSTGPMRKVGCGMVYFERALLCVVGGYGELSGPIQLGAIFMESGRRFSGRGWTNELHFFHLSEGGRWSSPVLTGSRPAPRSDFTLTLIKTHQAVLFAGYNQTQRFNDIHVIDIEEMCWFVLLVEGELPEPRDSHAACCLNYNGSHPQLLISGGRNRRNQVLNDSWLLCVVMRRWRKVDLSHDSQPRANHSLTAITLGEGLVETVSFGGIYKWPESLMAAADMDPFIIAETTVMRFESRQPQQSSSVSSISPPSEWRLTDMATSSQLGRMDRLTDKKAQLDLREALLKDHSAINFSMVQQLDQALNCGYIKSKVATCVAMGGPGSGKTHLRHFLFNQPPPEVRISTACIEQAQRAVLSAKDDDPTTFTCTPVDDTMVKTMTAENIKAGVHEQEKPAPTAALSPTTSQPTEAASEAPKESLDEPQASLSSSPEVAASQSPTASSSAAEAAPSSVVAAQRPALTRLPGTADIMKLMESSSGREQALEVHMVHFIDSGGQPQYLDMAPPFLHGLSMILAVSRLNERLSDTPNVEYFSSDLTYDLGNFDVPNEEMIVRAAQLTLFHKPQLALPCVSSPPTEPVCAVVGTFVDKEHECDETRAAKNERLETLLNPFSSQLIRRSNGEMIFPINGTTAGQQVAQPIAVELREAISRAPCFELDMPLQWQLLHVELSGLGLTVMLRSDVTPIAASLRFESREAIEAALSYIDLAHLFIYVPDVLPNVVVIEPDAIHKKSTQLLEEHIKLCAADDADIHSVQQLQFRNQAIFTTEWLYDLLTKYDKAVLSDEDLVMLLQYKLLLAELSADESSDARYFMPSLLPSQSEGEFVLPQQPPADALVVSFPFEMAPPGLFPAMIVALLASRCWNLYEVEVKKPHSQLHKNCVRLTLVGFPDTITLTNDSKAFAVHVSSSFSPSRLAFTRVEISKALNAVCEKFSFHKLHRVGFSCRCGVSPPHPAILSSDHTSTACSKDRKWAEPLTAKQKLWVTETTRDASTECAPEVQHEAVGTELQVKEESVQTESHFSGGYLRGVDVVARTEFTYTGAAESFEWSGHGFRLHFPEHVLPRDVSACVVDVKAAISGQFEFPEGVELVSGVYCIYCPHKFTQPVTVELQHCADITSHKDASRVSFIRAKCSQPDLPYHFKPLDGGVFSEHSCYGSVLLTHFSMVGVVKRKRHLRTNYCSQLYYRERSVNATNVDFVITKDLKLHIKAVKAEFSESGAVAGPHQQVVFAKNEIKMDIPSDGVPVGEGGSIIPLTHPGIRKDEVDCFLPGRRLPSCELLINRHTGSKVEVFRARLIGAKEPYNYFAIESHPSKPVEVSVSPPSSPPAQLLCKPTELDVNNAISTVNDWFELGQQLGIAFNVLGEIQTNNERFGLKRQRGNMVHTWLRSDPEASWSKLCVALDTIGERAVAQDVRESFSAPVSHP